ncbi:hypothetical protein ACF052_33110 [Streptomyces pilosus]|uniref:hypothetical protein n=1 Tax=Streptomyces pilosus TaxID=28893 RepID=UPI0036FC5991
MAHPTLLLVFNRIGPGDPGTVIAHLAKLTEGHWRGAAYEGDFHMYDGKLPIVATGIKHLKEHGPAGAVFPRFSRPQNQMLLEAIGNPRRAVARSVPNEGVGRQSGRSFSRVSHVPSGVR